MSNEGRPHTAKINHAIRRNLGCLGGALGEGLKHYWPRASSRAVLLPG